MEKSVLSKGKGAWAAGLVSGDPAERSCGFAGALLSHRVEKSSVYGIFLCRSALLCGGAREEAGDRKNQVRLFLNGRSKEFTAMEDSGNRLVEPVTGKPVSIIAAADAKEFGSEPAGVLMIPYRAVGTKSGMLPGILFDRMEIMDGENRSVRIDRPVVAVSKEPLFFRKDFTMILPESLFTDKL